MPEQTDPISSWAIVELLGRFRTAGRVTEETHFGGALGRCDVPMADGSFTTMYFSAASIYQVTPCSEEAARAVALRNKHEPVHQYELPGPKKPMAYAGNPEQGRAFALDGDDDGLEDDDFQDREL
jgi:hypothetical protein